MGRHLVLPRRLTYNTLAPPPTLQTISSLYRDFVSTAGAPGLSLARRLFLLHLCGLLLSSCIGCDPAHPKKQPYETLVFNVDTTRLDPFLTDPTFNIKIAPPKHWKQIDDSMLTQVTNALEIQPIDDPLPYTWDGTCLEFSIPLEDPEGPEVMRLRWKKLP